MKNNYKIINFKKFLAISFCFIVPITSLNVLSNLNKNDEEIRYAKSYNKNEKYKVSNFQSKLDLKFGKCSFKVLGKKYTLPSFDYYRFTDSNGKLLYIQADVAKNYNSPYIYVGVDYNFDNNGTYILKVNYLYDSNTIYHIDVLIDAIQFSHFEKISKKTDDYHILNRLRTSYDTIYKQTNDYNKTDSFKIKNENFDKDKLHEYANKIKNYKYNTKSIVNDSITDFIEKTKFYTIGSKLEFDNDFGCYISTYEDPIIKGDYLSDVVMFDVTSTVPNINANESLGKVDFEILFQYKYRCSIKEKRESWNLFDKDENQVIYLDTHYNAINYFYNNIHYNLEVFQIRPENAFITQMSYVNTYINIKDFYKSKILKNDLIFTPLINKKYNLNTNLNNIQFDQDEIVYLQNYTQQMNTYGKLIKSSSMEPKEMIDLDLCLSSSMQYVVDVKEDETMRNSFCNLTIQLSMLEDCSSAYFNNGWQSGYLVEAFSNFDI